MTMPEADVVALASELRTSVCRLRRRLAAERHPDAMSMGAMAVLGTLERRGPMTLGELAESEQVRAPSMTRIFRVLAERGCVVRRPHPDDRRVVLVELTRRGGHIVLDDRRAGADWLAQQLATLTPEERETLSAALPIVGRLSRCG